jgi:hypothetical protein
MILRLIASHRSIMHPGLLSLVGSEFDTLPRLPIRIFLRF